jgi:hypothetical protein
LHKTFVEKHPQETKNNGLVGLVLSLHHLYAHRLVVEPSQLQRKLQEQC